MTPNQFAQLYRGQGFSADLSIAGGRIAQILCDAAGMEYTITFYPRQEGGSSIDDFSAFSFLLRSNVPSYEKLDAVNELNKAARFVRYSLDEDVLSIEMDVAISSGELTEDLAMRQANVWIVAISKYRNAFAEQD